MDILKLIRYKNLIFVVVIQWLIYYAIITPILNKYGLGTLLPSSYIGLIILSTVMITAGGYIINDYFDIKIDMINKPEDVIVSNTISKKTAMRLYFFITIIGVIIGLIVSILTKNFSLAFIFVVVPGMLWFYSSSYKRSFLIGNIIVALASALSIFVLILAESNLQIMEYGDLIYQTPVLKELYSWVCGYAVFAFFITLIREIIKDMEDLDGDRELESRTMPIVWGEKKSKILVTALLFASLIAIFIIEKLYLTSLLSSVAFLKIVSPTNIFILLLFIILTILWYNKIQIPRKRYGLASKWMKIMMLIGILYSLAFYYMWAKTYNLTMFGIFEIVG